MDKGRLPFVITSTAGQFLALKKGRTGFLDAKFPFITKIDDVPIEKWIAAVEKLVPNSTPQQRALLSPFFLARIRHHRRVLGKPNFEKIEIELKNKQGEVKQLPGIDTINEGYPYQDWPKTESRIIKRGTKKIAYLRIPSMDKATLTKIKSFFLDLAKSSDGLIVDVRGNFGGTRDIVKFLLPYLMSPQKGPKVVNVAFYMPSINTDSADMFSRGLFPESYSKWTQGEISSLRKFKKSFRPSFKFKKNRFSKAYYFLLNPKSAEFHYDKKIVVLQNAECVSATDIFLNAVQQLENSTLLGESSSGASGRPVSFELDNSGLEVVHSSILSFRPNGQLFEGNGVDPDIKMSPDPTFFVGQSDKLLGAALNLFK